MSSVWPKTLGTQVASTIHEAALFAPELLDAEVLAVIRREALSGRLRESRAAQALEDLADWGVERIVHRELLQEAWRLRPNVSGYDAFYLASARLYDATVLTADGPLSRVPVADVAVQNIRLATRV